MAIMLIDPSEVLDYTFNWSSDLGEDTITGSAWTISPSGPTLSGSDYDDTTATIFVAGATAGTIYRLLNTVTTTNGTTQQRALILRCEDY